MAEPPAAHARPKPGRRGAETRARLMAAARAMLKSASPIELTAIAVSRAAGSAPPSFYVYFADTRDLLLALAEEASAAMVALARHVDVAWPPDEADARARAFVDDFIATWDSHCEVLAVRNLEADRGDPTFDEMRVQSSLPVLTALTDRFEAARPADKRIECFAEAVILYAALERLATVDKTTQKHRIQPRHYKTALARMIAQAMQPAAKGAP